MARQSPMRRRHSPFLPLRLRTSPAGRRSIAARMRSRSLRGSLRRVFAAAGATTACHEGSSGVRLRLRAQLRYGDRLAPPVGSPALIGRLAVLSGVGLVIERPSGPWRASTEPRRRPRSPPEARPQDDAARLASCSKRSIEARGPDTSVPATPVGATVRHRRRSWLAQRDESAPRHLFEGYGQSIRSASSIGPSSIRPLRSIGRYSSPPSPSQWTARSLGSTINSSSTWCAA